MSVIGWSEKSEQRQGNYSIEGGRIAHNYTRIFIVESNDINDSPNDVILGFTAGSTIGLRSPYATTNSTDVFSYCVDVRADFFEKNTVSSGVMHGLWNLTLSFAKLDLNYNNTNPLSDLPKVSVDFVQWSEICDVTVDGDPILNAASDPYDPPIERDQSRPQLSIQRNEASFSLSTAWNYRDTVNLGMFFGCAEGTVKCSHISATLEYDPGIGTYWTVAYVFDIEPNGWEKQILNAGYNQIISGVKSKILIGGSPAANPVPLDDNGEVIPPPVDNSNMVVDSWKIYPEIDFNSAFNFTSLDPLFSF